MAVSQEYEKEYGPTNGYYLIKKDGKWGYLNDKRKVVIPIQYDDAFEFNTNHYAIVGINGKYGLIINSGTVVLPIEFDAVYPIKDEVYIFKTKKGKLFGLYNGIASPEEILTPQFEEIDQFNSAGVVIVKKGKYYGAINKDGETVLEIKYPKIFPYSNGYAYYQILDANGKKKYGFVDEIGQPSKKTYDHVREFTAKGVAIVKLDGKYGIAGGLDHLNTEIKFDGINDFVGDTSLALLNAKFVLTDKYGEFKPYIGKIDWDTVITAMKGEGLTPVKKFKKYGYINDAGDIIIPCAFDTYTKFENGLALIKLNEKFGLINTNSQFVGKAEFEAVNGWKNGVYNVKKDGVWGTIDKSGKFKKTLTAEELAAQESEEDLIGNIQGAYNKMQEEEAKRNEVVYVAPKDLIELAFTEAKKVGTTEKLFDLTKVDTLFFTNEDKQLAFIKEGEKFATVNGYLEKYNTDETPAKGGFLMTKIVKENGKYKAVTSRTTVSREKFDVYSKGFIMNSFVKDKNGYMSCSPNELDFFDSEGSMEKSYSHSTHILVSATAIPGTNKYVVLGVRGVAKKDSYNEKRGQVFGISIFDKDLEKFSDFVEIRDMYNERWYINSLSTKVAITPDKEILISFKRVDANSKRSDGFGDDQHISKLDLDKLVDEGKIEYLWHVQFESFCIRNLEITSDGTMKGLLFLPGYDELASITANTNAKTKTEFTNSIKCKKTVKGSDQISQTTEGGYPLKNGKWITVGQGEIDYGYGNTIVLCYYDSDMSLIRQYRIPNKFNDFHLKELKSDFRLNSQFGYFGQDQDGASAFGGITGLKRPNMNNNSKDFHEMNFENCVYQIIPGDTENEIYVMTAYSILKIDLTKFAECKLKGKIPDYSSSSDDSSSDDDNSSDNSSTSTNSANATNTTKANTTTKVSTKCKILNDLKPDQVSKYNDVRLVFDNSQIVSKSLSRGQSMEVDCDDVVVHAGVLGSTDSKKVRKLFETKGKCGETIKLSDYW